MKKFYPILFYLLTTAGLQAQLETAHWYFGYNAGLDFTSGSPVAVTDGQIHTIEGSSVMSDNEGNLLFYTDGMTVYNKNHTIMVNGIGLLSNPSSTQAAIVVPRPEHPNIYYIFTIWSADGLHYSVVDMSLDGGNGAVIEKNNFLMSLDGPGGSEKLTAATIADCSGYWVLTHFIDSFYAFEITADGVNLDPVVSTVGIQSVQAIRGAGHIKLSPNGKRLAVAHSDLHYIVGALGLYDFDNSTGIVSNEVLLMTPSYSDVKQPYGVEFSPDNNLLYATYIDSNNHNTGTNFLIQYDLTADSIIDSEYVIDSWETVVQGALQLGLDNKIYHARDAQYLGVINNPNTVYNPGTGDIPDYNPEGIYLAGRNSTHGLPPFITSLFYADILINGIQNIGEYCEQELNFSYCHNGGEITDILWDFGDGATSNEETPVHTYEPGTYTLTLQLTIGQNIYTTQEELTIHPLPDVQNAELDKCVLQGEEAEFDLTESYPQINHNGEENITYSFHLTEEDAENNADPQPLNYATTSTTLWVRVENEWGCISIVQLELTINLIPTLNIETLIEICMETSTTVEIETETTNTINWYENQTDTTPIYVGDSFETPILIETTTYWVEVVSDEGCTSERIEVTVEVTESITPVFDLEEQYCLNSEPEEFPTESENGITGVWNSSTIDTSTTGTTIYTFTPDEGQCAGEYSIEIEITDIIIPEFNIEIQYCQGATPDMLHPTSDNGITGTWSPNTIDTSIPGTTTYVFTPDEGQCTEPYEITIEILQTQIPEFDLQTVYCVGSTPDILHPTSDNGIPGSWFPTTIDTSISGTQTYIFMPDTECGEEFILEVEITESIIPEFDIQTQYCLNTTPNVLPVISNNSITGSWSPATIDTGTTGTTVYIFTPGEECAETIEIQITISESIIPEFSNLPESYCLNSEAEILPTVADNGVSGSWFPQQINTNIQGITIYTFTPEDNQCSEEFEMIVTVYPHPDMELEEEIIICEGDSYAYTAPGGFDSYTWTDQNNSIISNSQEVTFTEEGIYTLTVEINGIPCPLSRNIAVSFSTTPIITEIKSTENTLTVYATGDGPFEYSLNEIFWQSSHIFHNLESGIYLVYVRDMKGCGSSAKQAAIMGIPNFISPNGDGYNDTWEIRALEAFPNTRLQIFDRNGKIYVDRIMDSDFEWNGKYNGSPLPSGSYWYILTFEDGEKLSGHINLRNY